MDEGTNQKDLWLEAGVPSSNLRDMIEMSHRDPAIFDLMMQAYSMYLLKRVQAPKLTTEEILEAIRKRAETKAPPTVTLKNIAKIFK